jgi:hypothetical protein
MPGRMSFFATTPQFRARRKWATRRLGWPDAKAGDRVIAIEKGQGLRLGEKQVVLGEILLVDARREQLDVGVTQRECFLEGFPDMDPAAFVEFFAKMHSIPRDTEVTRLEFRYLFDMLTALAMLEGHSRTCGTRPATAMIDASASLLESDGTAIERADIVPIELHDASQVLRRASLIFETGPGAAREWGLTLGAIVDGRVQLLGAPWPRPAQLELRAA